MAAKNIAFLGMGVMGSPMAINLKKAGHSVTVWNRSGGSARLKDAVDAGCVRAETIAEAVRGAEVVAVCVSRAADVEQVVLGTSGGATSGGGGVAEHARPGTLIIDFSTIGPDAAAGIGARCAERGLRFVDAPVSGGDSGAIAGTLTVMVGAALEDFERARPVFEGVGRVIRHCGGIGAGNAVKACNQILVALHAVAMSEAIHYAEMRGIDPLMMIEVCETGAAGSWALTNLGRRIVKGDLTGGFAIPLMLKDIGIVEDSLPGGMSLPGVSLARERFEKALRVLGEGATQGMVEGYRGE